MCIDVFSAVFRIFFGGIEDDIPRSSICRGVRSTAMQKYADVHPHSRRSTHSSKTIHTTYLGVRYNASAGLVQIVALWKGSCPSDTLPYPAVSVRLILEMQPPTPTYECRTPSDINSADISINIQIVSSRH